jgi:hypothetical protein
MSKCRYDLSADCNSDDCLSCVFDKIRAEIIMYEADCRLSVDEYPSCKQCTDTVFETIYGIFDKYRGESENKDV